MKNKEQIELKIKLLDEEMNQLTVDRQSDKDKYGGISEEANQDYFDSIHYINAQIKALEWVLTN